MNQLPMFDEDKENLKRYYSIGEVAEMFGVSKSLIRFWEGEFNVLKPHKNSKGDRRFTPKNIEQVQLIFHLVKERGFTLPGAKKEIARQQRMVKQKEKVVSQMLALRSFLEDLKQKL